jgi:hypothetical protein
MSTSPHNGATQRHGIALPVALAAIVVVGALISGVFFASTQEFRTGRNTLSDLRAQHGAEAALNAVLASWDSNWVNTITVGATASLADTTIGHATVKRRITRTHPAMFLVTSTANVGGGFDGRARKRLSAVVRIETPDFKIMGAITSRGRTETAGASDVSGNDTIPPGWDCPPGGAQGAGIVVNRSATNYVGSGTKYTVVGTPPVKDSTALVENDSTFNNFGGFTYDSLTKLATKIKTVGTTYGQVTPSANLDGTCNIHDGNNWGDIDQSDNLTPGCERYMPIVHLQGNNQTYLLNGNGGGQGIMLVDGNLDLAGTFRWTGLILVRGKLTVTGSANDGPKILGAVATMNQNNATPGTYISGGSQITFSRCVINQITSRYSIAAPLKFRSWAEMQF